MSQPAFGRHRLTLPISRLSRSIGGRGLRLIRAFMDEVGHNEVGNRIVMTKRAR